MSFRVDIDQGIELVRFVRHLTGNTRGPPGAATRNAIDVIMDRLKIAMEEVARESLQQHHSDGPPLTRKWVKQKDTSWVMGDVTPPPYATSASDKNVWSGFLNDQMTSWINKTYLTGSGRNEVHVGYNTNPNHPESGIDLMTLLSNIHFGWTTRAGTPVAPRPFLNSSWANVEYLRRAQDIISQALQNIITTGAP